MSTEDGRRVYDSAERLIELYRLNPARIEGTGKDGAVTKGDVKNFLCGEQADVPSQHPMTLYLATEGLDPEEIAERVRATHDGSNMEGKHVGLSVAKERRRESAWWNDPDVQAALAENYGHLKGVGEKEADRE